MNNKQIEEQYMKMKEAMSREFGIEYGFQVKAIGFIDSSEPYDIGEVPDGFIEKLRQVHHEGCIIASMGHHDCELCIKQGIKPAQSSSEKSMIDNENKINYIFPEMLFHYIEVHKYLPPKEFIEFIMRC